MITKMFARGYRTATILFIVTVGLVVALTSGLGVVAKNAGEAAEALRSSPENKTYTVQNIHELEGIVTYSVLVMFLAGVVGLILLIAVSQIVSSSFEPTVHCLRLLGISRRRLAAHFVGAGLVLAILGMIVGVAVYPLIIEAQSLILASVGLNVELIGRNLNIGIIFITWLLATAVVGFSLYSAITRITSHEPLVLSRKNTKKHWIYSKVKDALRYAVGVISVICTVLLFSKQATTQNLNQLVLGSSILVVIGFWSLCPLLIKSAGRLIKRAGSVGISLGGLLETHGNRIATLSLSAALLVGVSGASAILTLSSWTGSQFLAERSIAADAVTEEDVRGESGSQKTSNKVNISQFDRDRGWLLHADGDLKIATILRVNPEPLSTMLVSDAITRGSLTQISGGAIVADESKYHIGDNIVVRDDAGSETTLEVVALSSSTSILANTFVVDAASFPESSGDNVAHRGYATSENGLAGVEDAFADYSWLSNDEYIKRDLEGQQQRQMLSLASMVGGVAFVALVAHIFGLRAFARDLEEDFLSLRKLGMRVADVRIVKLGIGAAVGVTALLSSVAAVIIATWKAIKFLYSLEIYTLPPFPLTLLSALWAVIFLISVAVMSSGTKKFTNASG